MNKSELHNEQELVFFLVGAICLFFGFFLFFLAGTFIKRRNKLSIQQKSEAYQKSADDILFNLLFENIDMEEALERYKKLDRTPLLKHTMTRSVISMHRNYIGEQRALLEQFFELSGLTSFSYKKLKSSQWAELVEGIRVLSVLNIQESSDAIRKLLNHPNPYVKKEAFIGLITLKGIPLEIPLPEIVIDDWTQSCILYQLKIRSFTSFEGLHLFFHSDNDSLILLGARIVESFQMHDNYQTIIDMKHRLSAKYQESLRVIQQRMIKTLEA
jgi:hypothetical protein